MIDEARKLAERFNDAGLRYGVADTLNAMADALEELEAENEENAADSIRYSDLSETLYNALHAVAPNAAKLILQMEQEGR